MAQIRFQLGWVTLILVVVSGCAFWNPRGPKVDEVEAPRSWEAREPKRGLFGVDSRAREIEQSLGIH